jgi:hypothetical protein
MAQAVRTKFSGYELGASGRVVMGLALIVSPWAAFALNVLHGFADAVVFLGAAIAGLLLVASGLVTIITNPATTSVRWKYLLHGTAVAGIAVLLLLMTARALGA